MATHRRAARGRYRTSHGVHRLRICHTKTVVAPSRHCDVRFDYCLRVHPWRVEPDSSRDHVARNHQRFGVWWRVRLVFLFQTKRRRVFSRIERSVMDCKGEAACFPKRWTRDAGSAPIENFRARLAHRSIAATRSRRARALVASRSVKAAFPQDSLRPVRDRWRWLAAPNR
jgi:hypothetical protein